jgi:hypothetical protein
MLKVGNASREIPAKDIQDQVMLVRFKTCKQGKTTSYQPLFL